MATRVHSIPASSTLHERRPGSRLQLRSQHPSPLLTKRNGEDEITRIPRAPFTPLTPIVASPVLTPATTTVAPSNDAILAPPIPFPSASIQGSSVGIAHQRSRSTLSRLHISLPDNYFEDPKTHTRAATLPTIPVLPFTISASPPSPRLLNDIIFVDGVPIAKTPTPSEETPLPDVDLLSDDSPQISFTPRASRSRSRSSRKPFILGSDDEDETSDRQKREAIAKAKKLERFDNLRRYNALMELLKTEAKYLQDLRILTNVYLQQLHYAVTTRPVSSYFASPSKPAGSPSPAFSPTQSPGQLPNPPPSPVQSYHTIRKSIAMSDRIEIEKDLPFARPIFTEEEVQLLCRNSSEILAFHERFVDDLKEALAPLGSKFRFDSEDEYAYVDMPRYDTLELAIEIIVSMFVDRVESFKLYKLFCSTHSEAVELVQRARKVSSSDWVAWEKRCRRCVLDNYLCGSPPVPSTGAAVHFELGDTSPQAKSGLRSQTTKLRRAHSFTSPKPSKTSTVPPHPISRPYGHGQTTRLAFLDQMIKPVQRICKYPLLLDQLKSRVPHSHKRTLDYPDTGTANPAELFSAGQTESLVTHACEAMRQVVNSVNDDRRKHEDRWKIFVIASRTVVPSLIVSPSPAPPAQLTPEVLTTLGNCSLSGALDVIYHRPTTSAMTKAKYLGVFLYEQGYLVLVKVGKSKAYEPQHWFPLKDFDVLDPDEDASFPYSFHLTGCGHNFQFASACQKEKNVWMGGLRKAAAAAAESDLAELPSSLSDENKEGVSAVPSVIHNTSTDGLPVIQSRTGHVEEFLPPRPGISKAVSESRALSDDGHSIRTDSRPHSQPVSRRGSSNSVRAIFSPFLFDSGARLVRPTLVQRHHTDHGLSDVFSDLFRDARSSAVLQGQELFQLPRQIIRSKSGVAVQGFRGRKDSRIFNRRSYAGTPFTSISSPSADPTPNAMGGKAKCKKERPSGVMRPQTWFGEDPTPTLASALGTHNMTSPSSDEDQLQSSLPEVTTSLCSSEATSNVGSSLGSPGFQPSALGSPYLQLDAMELPPENSSDMDRDYRPKRSKSMVDNVKSFFNSSSRRLSRYPSRIDLMGDGLSSGKEMPDSPTSYHPDPLKPSLPSVTVHPVEVDAEKPPLHRPQHPRTRNSLGDLGRKRSLFIYGRRNETGTSRLSAISTMSATSSTTGTSGSNSPIRRRSVKDILLHFRNG